MNEVGCKKHVVEGNEGEKKTRPLQKPVQTDHAAPVQRSGASAKPKETSENPSPPSRHLDYTRRYGNEEHGGGLWELGKQQLTSFAQVQSLTEERNSVAGSQRQRNFVTLHSESPKPAILRHRWVGGGWARSECKRAPWSLMWPPNVYRRKKRTTCKTTAGCAKVNSPDRGGP